MNNRRTQFVINKKAQYQYALFVIAVAILAVNLFVLAAIFAPGLVVPGLTPTVTLFLGLAELLLLAMVWFGSIRLSHRVAGPVYVIAREIGAFARGDHSARVHLRTKDLFQDESLAINASLELLGQKFARVGALVEQIEKDTPPDSGSRQVLEQIKAELSVSTDGREA
jgi:methyl-accepting chemotaxis protein